MLSDKDQVEIRAYVQRVVYCEKDSFFGERYGAIRSSK